MIEKTKDKLKDIAKLVNDIDDSIEITEIRALKKRFLVKQGRKLVPVPIGDVAYFVLEGRFVFLRKHDGQKYVTPFSLSELKQVLDPTQFFQVNRAYIVAMESVVHMIPYIGHRLKLILKPDAEGEVIVSRERVNALKSWLGE